jgi:RimJ/RimL family protein N-acetyltransferase
MLNDRKEELSIRAATVEDAELFWHWANDRSVREQSFNIEPINWESHLEWFNRRVASPTTRFYLLLEDDEPVGQIRYDRAADEQSAEIGFSISKEHRGKGLGVEILRLTVRRALQDLDCRKITALVIEGNEASRKAFLRAGFQLEGSTEIKGRQAESFVWKLAEN